MVSKVWITFINGTNIEIIREKNLPKEFFVNVRWMRGRKSFTTYDFTGFSSYSWRNTVVDVLVIHFEFTIFHNCTHSFGIIVVIHVAHCKSMVIAAFGDKRAKTFFAKEYFISHKESGRAKMHLQFPTSQLKTETSEETFCRKVFKNSNLFSFIFQFCHCAAAKEEKRNW